MVSEMNTILSGQIVKSVGYDSDKKIIGIAAANLIPDAQGIVPLSKQSAFVQEEYIDPELQAALEQGAVAAIEGQFAGMPIDSEELDNPITMGDTTALTSAEMPKIDSPIDVTALVPERVEEKREVVDEMELPQMESVIGGEPMSMDDGLFDMPAGMAAVDTNAEEVVMGETPVAPDNKPINVVEPVEAPGAPEIAPVMPESIDPPSEPALPSVGEEMPLPGDASVNEDANDATLTSVSEPMSEELPKIDLPDFDLPSEVIPEEAPIEEVAQELPQDETPFEEVNVTEPMPEMAAPVGETIYPEQNDALVNALDAEEQELKNELYRNIDIALDNYLAKKEALDKKKSELTDGVSLTL